MSFIPLTEVITTLRTALHQVEQASGEAAERFAVAELKIEFPARMYTQNGQVFVELPAPDAEKPPDPALLSRLSLAINPSAAARPGPPAPPLLPWTKLDVGAARTLHSVWAGRAGDVYVVGAEGTLRHSPDGGRTWHRRSPEHEGKVDLHGVWGNERGVVYAVGTSGLMLRSSGGVEWTEVERRADGTLHAIWGNGRDVVCAVGEGGTVLRLSVEKSEEAGSEQWERYELGGGTLRAVGGHGATLYAVGDEPQLFFSRDGGRSWEQRELPEGGPFHGLWDSGLGTVFIVGEEGRMLRFFEADERWEVSEPLTEAPLHCVWGSGLANVYAAGRGGALLRSTDGGQGWVREESGRRESLLGAWGVGAERLYFAGTDGLVLSGPAARPG